MQIQTLKREALEERQYLERLLTVYDAFQNYVEALKSSINGEVTGDELLVVSERFRLKFAEYENLFYEWEDGEQHLNAGLSAFTRLPDNLLNADDSFRVALLLATEKFRDILEKRGRSLREIHERIVLEEGQSKAEEVTHVPSSALAKLKNADSVAEILSKWGGRAVAFGTWAHEIIKNLHH
jgi:hypothetical protein